MRAPPRSTHAGVSGAAPLRDAGTDVEMAGAVAHRTRRRESPVDAPMDVDAPIDPDANAAIEMLQTDDDEDEEPEVEEPIPAAQLARRARGAHLVLVNAAPVPPGHTTTTHTTTTTATTRPIRRTASGPSLTYAPSTTHSAAHSHASSSTSYATSPSTSSFASACGGPGPSSAAGYPGAHGKGKENIPPPNEGGAGGEGAQPRRSARRARGEPDAEAADAAPGVPAPAPAPATSSSSSSAARPRAGLRRARTTSSVPHVVVDRATGSPSGDDLRGGGGDADRMPMPVSVRPTRGGRRGTRASQDEEMRERAGAPVEAVAEIETEAEVEGSRDRKRARRTGSALSLGAVGASTSTNAAAGPSSRARLGPSAAPSSPVAPPPMATASTSRGRQALGRSVSYAGPSSSAVPLSRALSTLSAGPVPASSSTPTTATTLTPPAGPAPSTTPLRRRSSAASSAALSASVAGLGLGLGRRPSGRRRELSVGSGSVAGSVRSEYSPGEPALAHREAEKDSPADAEGDRTAPPSSPSASSTLSLPAAGQSFGAMTTAPAASTRRPALGKRTSTASSAYTLATPATRRTSQEPAAPADITMDPPTDHLTPSLFRTSSSSGELHLEGLTIGGLSTPTKRKAGQQRIASLATPTSLPSLSASGGSSSPAYDERLLTPRMGDSEMHVTDARMEESNADGMELDLELGVKQNKHLDGYKALKASLRCSSASTGEASSATGTDVHDGLVGRSVEKEYLRKYLLGGGTEVCQSKVARGLYISGPPGTGKTAVVTALARQVCESTTHGDWRVAVVNCMGLSSGRARDDLWTRIADAWGIAVTKNSSAERAVEVELRGAGSERSLLLVLDEVDILLPQRSTAGSAGHVQLFKTLMSLSITYPEANIKVIAISNSLDLTFRTNVASVLGDEAQPDNLIFPAYEIKDMMQIIRARIAAASDRQPMHPVAVDEKAIELVARKVEAQNGDLRMCLSVMVAAVEMSESDYKSKLATSVEAGQPIASAKVSLPHVSKAVAAFAKLRAKASGLPATITARSPGQAAGSAELNAKVGALSLQVRMVLLAYLVAVRRQELALKPIHASTASASYNGIKTSDNLSAEGLYLSYAYLLSHPSSPFPPASQPDYMDLIMQLEVLGLFSLDAAGSGSPSKAGAKPRKSGKGKEKMIALLAKREDLEVALGLAVGNNAGVALQDEIRGIWTREEARCIKAMEGRQRSEEWAKRMADTTCSREELL